MTDITVVILTCNEHLHLQRCFDKLAPLEVRQVVVVDSGSTDDTIEIARRNGALVVEHAWPGTQAKQFNWFVDNCGGIEGLAKTGWILRLDADEYLTPELIEEIKSRLPAMPADTAAVVLKRRHIFAGKWVKFGTYPVKILRLYRAGRARYDDNMLMDEHLHVDGNAVEFAHDFVDHSLIAFGEWRAKHEGYAEREAQMVLSGHTSENKRAYYSLPLYLRAVLYFISRYVLRGGFLNGKAGLKWDFWQGLWYRWTVDLEIGRLKKRRGADVSRQSAVDLARYRNRHPLKNLAARFLWQAAWAAGASWTPRYVLNGWRRLLLRMFGAKVGKGCRLTSSMEVWTPSRLFMGRSVWIDRNVYLYDVERITIGDNAIVSDGAFICTAGHDITKSDFPLTVAPVEIGAGAWVAARAIVLPGVKIGEGAVVAAGAVVSKDVEPWTVVAGNPARPVKKREVVPSGT